MLCPIDYIILSSIILYFYQLIDSADADSDIDRGGRDGELREIRALLRSQLAGAEEVGSALCWGWGGVAERRWVALCL